MPDADAKEILYTSVYTPGVDGKRRFHLPFRWRSAKSTQLALVISTKHEAGACLRVLPPAQFAKVRQQIEEMPITERALAKRNFGNSCVLVAPDGAGRIALPEEMMKVADLGSEVVLSGLIDYFEVWNPKRYHAAKLEDAAKSPNQNQFLE